MRQIIRLLRMLRFWDAWRTFTAKCGHATKLKGVVSACGETVNVTLRFGDDGRIAICHGCLSRTTIPCAYCGRPISHGSGITLYAKTEEKLHSHAKFYKQLPIGCCRRTCRESFDAPFGWWLYPGVVREWNPTATVIIATDVEQMMK